jgi:hypothetical protein
VIARGRPRRRLGRACGCLLVIVVLVLVLGGVVAAQALATPDLGAPPGGADNGSSQNAIATRLGTGLGAQLLLRQHGVVELSEHDLTVLIREHNPNPARLQEPEIRVRNALVAVDAHTPVGPFNVWAVARLALARTLDSGGVPQVSASFHDIQVGNLGLPDTVTHAIQDRVQSAFDLQDLLGSDPTLKAARQYLECVRVSGTVVRIGFHRPDAAADAHACG